MEEFINNLKKLGENKSWYYRAGLGVVIAVISFIIIVKGFLYIRNKERAEIKNSLVEDDKKDIIFHNKNSTIETAVKEVQKEIKKREDHIEELSQQKTSIDDDITQDLKIIDSIQTWDDVAKKVN